MLLNPVRKPINSISSISNLASALGIDEAELIIAQKMPLSERYKEGSVPKASGGERAVFDPAPIIRKIQKRINTRIFKDLVGWPDYLYGSIPNESVNIPGLGTKLIERDYIACASKHCGSKSIFKADVSNFFDNIHKDFVNHIFRDFFKYPPNVSDYLTDICCRGDGLVQGALTSSYIATLCLWDVEGDVVKKLARRNLVYTRLVDDITVSSKSKNQDYGHVQAYLLDMLLQKDLPLNASKSIIQRAGIEPLMVHGLRVDFSLPRLPSSEVSNIRAAVHNVLQMAKVNNLRTSSSYRKQYDRCMGRVNKLARVGHKKHKLLINKLRYVRPLPSKRDIKMVERAIKKLNAIPLIKRSEYRYKRLHGITRYRAGIINRTFKKEAKALLLELQEIQPVYLRVK